MTMAEEFSENTQSEILRHLQTLIVKSGEHDKRFDMIDENFGVLREQVKIMDGKLTDIASKVIEIDKRLAVVEARLGLMENRLTALEEETRQIRLELDELNDRAETVFSDRTLIDQLEVRLFQLEEKLATDH